jgi:hypothetical protein
MLAPNAAFFTTVTTPTFEDVSHPVNNRVDASYQVSLHLAEGFPRRRLKCEKLTDDRRPTPSDDGKSSHCLWQGELKITCHYYVQGRKIFF